MRLSDVGNVGKLRKSACKNIHGETGESVAIQSWDGDQVEITRDNVEEVL